MRFYAVETTKSKIIAFSNQSLSAFASDLGQNRIAKRNEIDILSITEAKTKSLRDCETANPFRKVLRKAGDGPIIGPKV